MTNSEYKLSFLEESISNSRWLKALGESKTSEKIFDSITSEKGVIIMDQIARLGLVTGGIIAGYGSGTENLSTMVSGATIAISSYSFGLATTSVMVRMYSSKRS